MSKDVNLHRIKWLCIFISIGSITAFTLPYPISILLAIGGILIFNGFMNRLKLPITDKVTRSNSITSFLFYNPTQCHQSMIYICTNCNIVHMKSECPRCKSKTKRIL
ncbi:MAG TPA: hypothetical protein VJ583_10345 [Nitrososphaeraceae archaeon]|nr:hypothetical protein [Nitrososphaeraceae archaeon]